jgi:aldose 1-epimerase
MKGAVMAIILAALAGQVGAGQAAAATVTRADFGVTAKGEKVSAYTLTNDHGMSVKILDYGGTITAINVPDRAGKMTNVALDLGPLKAYEARPNFSSLIGRFANRISGGGFTLDGVRYDLTGAGADGMTSHGGPGAFSTKVWKAKPFKSKGKAGVSLSYISADGENGYPGEVKTRVDFTLDNRNQLTLVYHAVTDKPTQINFTHHLFLNLAGSGTAAGHKIQIMASKYLPLDAKKLVTGEIADLTGSPLDARTPKVIGDALLTDDAQVKIAKGYDHNYVLDKTKPDAFNKAAVLSDPASGRVVTVTTTEPGLQFYSGGPFNGSLIDAKGNPIQSMFGLALETQHYPNSPNIAAFPSTVLRPGEVFRSKTQYRFSTEGLP